MHRLLVRGKFVIPSFTQAFQCGTRADSVFLFFPTSLLILMAISDSYKTDLMENTLHPCYWNSLKNCKLV